MAEDVEYISELFSAYGPVAVRRMFGGAGVFANGLMIALAVDGVIYLKADDAFIPEFERLGLSPFSYETKDGGRTLTSYWRMPERLYDEPGELAVWAAQAMESARRSRAGHKPAGRRTGRRRPRRVKRP